MIRCIQKVFEHARMNTRRTHKMIHGQITQVLSLHKCSDFTTARYWLSGQTIGQNSADFHAGIIIVLYTVKHDE